jgi:FAD/FMN-containing dehydrogenase
VRLAGSEATVGPGVRNLALYAALARRGAAVASGSCPNVAIGGLVLNGGMGLAGRSFGLTLDRVTGFDVVGADGVARHVDERSDEALFWALRGGGGSFALLTGVHLRVRALRRAAFFYVSFPAAAAEEVLAAWDGLAPTAPRALTSICTLSSARVSAFGQYLGSEAALRRLVRPLTSIGGARVTLGTDDFLALQRRWAACADGAGIAACAAVPRASFDASSIYVEKRLSARGRRAFVAATRVGATLVCDAYGGAINAVPRGATAFVHRDVRFSVQILSYAPIGTARVRVNRARRLLAPYGNGAAYQNYPDLDLADAPKAYWGSNLARLKEIKASADPDGRFLTAQGVR